MAPGAGQGGTASYQVLSFLPLAPSVTDMVFQNILISSAPQAGPGAPRGPQQHPSGHLMTSQNPLLSSLSVAVDCCRTLCWAP